MFPLKNLARKGLTHYIPLSDAGLSSGTSDTRPMMMDYDEGEDEESTPISPGPPASREQQHRPYSNNTMNIPPETGKQNVSEEENVSGPLLYARRASADTGLVAWHTAHNSA